MSEKKMITKEQFDAMSKDEQIETLKKALVEQSQVVVDLAGLFMPVSGITMAIVGSSGVHACKMIGVEIRPDGKFFDMYITYENALINSLKQREVPCQSKT